MARIKEKREANLSVTRRPRYTTGHQQNVRTFRTQKSLATVLYYAVLRIQDVYAGSKFFHSGYRTQGLKDPGSQIRIQIKEFKYF
jgi:hypothetical protein